MICQLTSILSGSPDLYFFNIKPLTNATAEHGHLPFGRAELVTKDPAFPCTKGQGRKCSKPVILIFFFLKHLKDFKC